ncbi:MAG: TPM domain-containing protein [Clostridia bacterium]|nr:TPM domain-containing protein [Clostridia bacterium]
MKRKIISLSLLLLMLVLSLHTSAFALNPPVIDEAGYLTNYQLDSLNKKLDEIRNEYNTDVVVYIEQNMVGDDRQARADDIYDYNGYGIGSNYDGIMMYISANPREYVFTTCGSAMTAFNSRGIDYLTDVVDSYMHSSDYYSAISAYAETAAEMLEMARGGHPYNEKKPMNVFIAWAIGIIAPFIIAAIATKSRGKRMNTARYQDYANEYMKPGSMNLDVSRDIFVYSTVTRTKRVKQNSGTHTSSSGRTHGGGGGGSY